MILILNNYNFYLFKFIDVELDLNDSDDCNFDDFNFKQLHYDLIGNFY